MVKSQRNNVAATAKWRHTNTREHKHQIESGQSKNYANAFYFMKLPDFDYFESVYCCTIHTLCVSVRFCISFVHLDHFIGQAMNTLCSGIHISPWHTAKSSILLEYIHTLSSVLSLRKTFMPTLSGSIIKGIKKNFFSSLLFSSFFV